MTSFAFRLTAIAIAAAAAGCASPGAQRSASEPATQPPVVRADVQPRAEVPLIGPLDAKPGECYARVFNPARYETQSAEVVKTAASERIELIPATTEQVEEQVLIKPATTTIELVPAVYETVQEQVIVEPERTVIEQVPAVYETVTEQVMVKPALQVWKKASEGASSAITRVEAGTGEVLCLVEEPAQYETVTKQVVKTPATTRERVIPAKYQTVERQVLKTPASTREVEVPAEYATVTVTKVVEPAREQRVTIPAEFETVQRTVLAAPAKEEWRQVLCEANTRPEEVRALQEALRSAGYDPGTSDGRLNAQTMRALRQYQSAQSLPVDRGEYVNMKTVQALGLEGAGSTAAEDESGQNGQSTADMERGNSDNGTPTDQ